MTATDPVTSLSASLSYVVSLSHANRPPSWSAVPWLSAAALTSGTVGPPLLQYVVDLDLALNVGENETFAITGGNAGGTFGVQPGTGQLFIANNNTAAFQFGQPPFNLTVSVTDAGVNGPRYTATAVVTVQVLANNFLPTLPFVNCTVFEAPPLGPAPGTPVCTVTGDSRNTPNKLTYALNAAGASLNLPVRRGGGGCCSKAQSAGPP